MSDYIPDHILANVLLRLPFNSLVRYRCVSKSWRDVVDSCYFMELHCRRIISLIQTYPHPDSRIIALVGTQFYTFDLMVKDGRKWCKAIAKELSSPPMEFVERGLDLAGSCNGILCLSNFWTGDLMLWNPFTRSSNSHRIISPPFEFTKEYRSCMQAAFGYDHLNDDYKVVKWYNNDPPRFDRKGLHLYELCVYSLKQNSWRTIRDAAALDLHARYGYFPENCAFVNGAMHWVVEGMSRSFERFILAFDLGSYEFRKISYPPYPAIPGFVNPYFGTKLSSLNGCLSLVCFTHYRTLHEKHSADVWMMEEYGVESSWTKLGSIDLQHQGVEIWEFKPAAFLRKRRKLLLQNIGKNLMVYDLKSRSLRDVAIEGEERCLTSCVCIGSFVSPLLYK